LEVEEFVLEDEGDYGVYLIEGQTHESNTSKLSYSWGVDKNTIRTQYVEPAAREIIREIKRRGKVVSQDEAIAIAFAGIKKHKEQYTVFGTEMHKAFQNFDEGKPVTLPTPKHQAFFQGFLYFRKQHEIKPILIEKLLVCPHCGITTQIDNFSEVDGLNTIMDYKTGRTVGFNTSFQLAINKHVLEHLEYKVDRTWAVHVQDFLAYSLEMCAPWEDVELRLKNADLKRKTLNPKIYVREFSGEKKETAELTQSERAAVAAGRAAYKRGEYKALNEILDEIKEASAVAKTSEERKPVPDLGPQGHLQIQVKTEPLPTTAEITTERIPLYGRIYPGPAEKRLLGIDVELSPTVAPKQKRRKDSQHKDPSASISSRKADSRQRTRPEEVELNPKHVHPKRLKRRLFQQAA